MRDRLLPALLLAALLASGCSRDAGNRTHPTPVVSPVVPAPTGSASPRFSDPRELAAYATERAELGDWAALQYQLADEYQAFSYGANAPLDHYSYILRPGIDVGRRPEQWTFEEYDSWIVVRLEEQLPAAIVVRRLDDGTLRLDPGPCARQTAAWWRALAAMAPTPVPTVPTALPVQMTFAGDDLPLDAIHRRFFHHLICVGHDDGQVLVTAQLTFRDSTGSIEMGGLHWLARDGRSGDARVVWSDAVLTGDALQFPLPDVTYTVTWQLLDAPADGSAVLHIDTVTIDDPAGPALTFAMEVTTSARPYPDPGTPTVP